MARQIKALEERLKNEHLSPEERAELEESESLRHLLEELPAGGVELRLRLSSLAEIQRWILGWAGAASGRQADLNPDNLADPTIADELACVAEVRLGSLPTARLPDAT